MSSLPTMVSHLFRGHQVLGDSAPELPPDLAQQNTLADPSSQICLSVRTSPDQVPASQQRRRPQTITTVHLSGISANSNQRSSSQNLSPEKGLDFPYLARRATDLGHVSLFTKAARELRANQLLSHSPWCFSYPLFILFLFVICYFGCPSPAASVS